MKLRELLEAVDLKKKPVVDKKEAAESPCQFLSACNINFVKTFRDDDTGADFEMDNAEDAIEAVKQLKTHKKIKKNFVIKLEKGSNTIKVFFRKFDK